MSRLRFDDVGTEQNNMNSSDGGNGNDDQQPKKKGMITTEFNIKKQMAASIMGGMVTAMVVTPLDVVKTRLQTQIDIKAPTSSASTSFNFATSTASSSSSSTKSFKGTMDAFVQITKHEGIFTLWRGLTPSLLMTIPSTAIYFTTYEYLKQEANQLYPNINNVYMIPLVTGSLARVISASVTSPFELVRTNSQGIIKKNLKLVPLIKDIVNNVGFTGLWRGLVPTLIRDVPFSAFYWAGYEIVKNFIYTNYKPEHQTISPFLVNFSAGAMSGSIAAILTTPIDVIKTRVQMTVQGGGGHSSTTNASTSSTTTGRLFNQARSIIQNEGWGGFTKGMIPRVAKVAPACAIMVSTYEWVKSVNLPEQQQQQ
ncbi:mitochondrial substrate carrier family protein [Cavenderia fasciculata]|uniref:Mitochondrial substrate carrier family protein n=1 Tax=Cavenderia fasciculata TaxID=261658 RepID=F4PWC0_CACFS|nr:mitochondrial substrate carrier family protein [Cavenderia fasciculata]EGG20284.1 mitochondrial substrate carrier family protein [Cavenderia fasciculata]|eukprot:XP_004367267.1 mitochondrial substrate carrier family protein [Cavenderia fasciculata]